MTPLPIFFSQLIGHEMALRLLRRAVSSGDVAHAYLFTGAAGVGKHTVAHAFAAALACLYPTPEGEACGECESCRRLMRGSHPEVHTIAPYSEQTLIWQLWDGHSVPREAKGTQVGVIGRTINFAPQFGRRIVYILTRAETLTEAAANSLLKTIEEPPPYAVFLLLAPMPEDVIETIRSRCQWVPLYPVDTATIAEWLVTQYGVEPSLAQRCARLSQGCPGKACAFATQPQAMQLWDSLSDLAYAVATETQGVAPALVLAERLRSLASLDIPLSQDDGSYIDPSTKTKAPSRGALLLAMDALCAWFRDALWLAGGGNPERITFQGDEKRLGRAASAMGVPRLMQMLDAVLDVRRAVEGNANIQLATEVLMMRLLSP
jgi:DNA polymerase III subunit delta'